MTTTTAISEAEARMVAEAVEAHGGIAAAARALGKTRPWVQRRVRATRATTATPGTDRPSPALALSLQAAHDHFNGALFDGKLPAPVFVWQRKKNCRGHFCPGVWARTGHNDHADEISLNPDLMEERTPREILSTLVHEMVHQLQHHFGEPSRNGYHNAEWGEMMDAVDLTPTATGYPGGKRTGQAVTHMIVDGGRFDLACARLLDGGWAFPFSALDTRAPAKPKAARKKTRLKYTCPKCKTNAWAKPGVEIACAPCMERMQPEDE